ncbi:MAG: serine/threonine protein kinase [Elusimicrobia bacterium]|nr:serine/threonine protein kinase [Elusimicrobiota bacterium]
MCVPPRAGPEGQGGQALSGTGLVIIGALLLLALMAGLALRLRARGAAEDRPAGPARPVPPEQVPAEEASQVAAKGRVIGDVEIVRLIAEGGMGEIYEGLDRVLQRKVALKRMRPEIRADSVGKEAFLKEARIVAALQHPNIVQIHSVIDTAQDLCLVFEFIDGITVRDLIDREGSIPVEACRSIIRETCSALAFAHGRRVLHRDLKPANIMLSSAGVVKVMDFGIARQAQVTLSRITPGAVCGTMAYMSPEQHLGLERQPGDFYALAASLYHMVAGELPFPGPEHLTQKERLDYRPLSLVVPGLGPKVDAFMEKAFARDPGARFQRAQEFLDAFEEAFGRS